MVYPFAVISDCHGRPGLYLSALSFLHLGFLLVGAETLAVLH
jgi:hypothetical protein